MTREETEKKALEALSDTRARMVSFKIPNVQKPAILFFASLILRLEPTIDWSIKTASTDGEKLYLNPEWWLGLRPEERFTICAHEVAHLAQLHHLRQGHRNIETWNLACDLAINSWLSEAGFVIPEAGCLAGRGKYGWLPHGKAAEEYYDLLTRNGGGDGGQQQQQGGGGGGGGQQQKQQPKQQQQQQQDGDGEGEGEPGEGDQPGDGQGDQPGEDGGAQPPDAGRPGRPASDPGGCGTVEPSPKDEAERSEKEGRTKIAVVQAAQAAKSQGKAPGWMDRLIDQMLVAKQDWKELLREFVTRTARNEHSYRRPNRRYLQQGLIMPSLRGEELGDVIVTVDCSGSIGQEELDSFAAELQSIVETFICKVTILYHDIPVTHVQQWCPTDGPLKLKPHGGGGTSHVPVFDHIQRKLQDDDAPCIICFTDLYTDFPDKAPQLPVLWAVFGNDRCTQRDVPFGQLVKIEE
jgi:predicted metal-dependent peptidase